MYSLCLDVRIKSITCPGVWLCPKGEIVLKVNVFGISRKTTRIHARFPLCFDETLSFERFIVGGIGSVARMLEEEQVHIELIQWMSNQSSVGIILAKMSERFIAFFEPFIIDTQAACTSNLEILIDRTNYFPGIISPKLSAVFHLLVKDSRYGGINSSYSRSASPNYNNYLVRQRPVCHAHFKSTFRNSDYHNNYSNCSFCSTWPNKADRFEEPTFFDSVSSAGTKNSCWWCNRKIMSCNCCCCFKYHQTFH